MITTQVRASGPGALDGFEATCHCGLTLRNSLETALALDIFEHMRWHRAEQPEPPKVGDLIRVDGGEAGGVKQLDAIGEVLWIEARDEYDYFGYQPTAKARNWVRGHGRAKDTTNYGFGATRSSTTRWELVSR